MAYVYVKKKICKKNKYVLPWKPCILPFELDNPMCAIVMLSDEHWTLILPFGSIHQHLLDKAILPFGSIRQHLDKAILTFGSIRQHLDKVILPFGSIRQHIII